MILLSATPPTQSSFIDLLRLMFGASILSVILAILIPIVLFVLKLTLPIICAVHAKRKGYSAIGFYLYGLLSFVIAMGVIILATPKNSQQNSSDSSLEEEQIAEIKGYYENGTISYTQMCQKIDEIKMRKYNK